MRSPDAHDRVRVIVVSGVSGSGKSRVAQALAARLSLPFQEGDELHPAANIARMRAGHALDDEDRREWLAAVSAWIDAQLERDGGVITCSALRRTYRQALVRGRGERIRFLFLLARPDVLEQRLSNRVGHFMPPSLLPSQLSTLESPDADEGAVLVHVDDIDVQTVVDRAVVLLEASAATPIRDRQGAPGEG
ncbi:MAG: carbohydrate kinase, thermoresistant glucokinase family [Panacagrimonas sp.]|nr:gluconokinase, GntK/IdnK-type [Panacagrimonas sp.]MCC2659105.1 carbohydrate kinase, thermoresistant glucokinase family [Panacagrimonas sp.]